MVFRSVALSLCALVLCAADYPPPPAQLEPYIKDGHFEPGDYAWMKGRFADATPEEQEAFRTIQLWATECRETALAELRAQLAALGHAEPQIDSIVTGPLLCQQVMFQPQLPDYGSFAEFQQELATARPVADAFLTGVALSAEIAAPREPDFARLIVVRRITDQAARTPMFWGNRAGVPQLTPVETAIFLNRVARAALTYDHDNTAWLKDYVAEHGWPKISEVGEEASGTAWLLVQHADADPVFQLQALQLMEPLVREGEVSKQNYAYLYDRVMLKLAGKQRYGTQATCADGRREPLPLEDEADLDRLRQEMALGSEAEYLAMMDTNLGPCQQFVRPPA